MPSVKLDVPYHSQWDPNAKNHFADCGPTSLSMLLGALGDNISPDELYRYIGDRGASQYTSFGDLTNAAKGRGLTMTRKNFPPATALQELRNAINAATPFVALVNYAFWDPIVKNGFKGSHFVLVTGYDDEKIYIHDPLFKGNRRDQGMFCAYTHDQFMDAWGGFAPGQNPNYAALISGKAVRFLESSEAAPLPRQEPPAQSKPAPVTKPAAPAQLDDLTRRRIRAKAAFEGLADPNLDDSVVANALLSSLGQWGATAESYTVRRGDSLTKIATIFYSDREKWKVIVYFNNIAHPSLVEPGDVYLIPKPSLGAANEGKVALPGFGGPVG